MAQDGLRNMFFRGRPYGPDLDRLDEAFPSPKEGDIIQSQEIAEVIGEDRSSNRYKGVVTAWRKRLRRERNIDTDAVVGVGIKVLPPADRLRCSERDYTRGVRQQLRSEARLMSVPRERLDEKGQHRYDHARSVLAKTRDAVLSARRELAVDIAPVKSLPKRQVKAEE